MTIQTIQTTPNTVPPFAAQNTASSVVAQSGQITTANTTEDGAGQDVDAKELAGAIDKVQNVTQTLANELKFNIDQDSGRTVVKIVDSTTDEVIRQIPSKEMLAIADALDQIQGLLIKQKA